MEIPQDEVLEHSRGAWLAKGIQARLGEEWALSEIENWRDSGWAIESKTKGREIRISFASNEENEWMLQVCPVPAQGLIGSLFGAKASASDEDTYQAGLHCDRVLKEDLKLEEVLWCWNAFPDPDNSSDEPQSVAP